jgi:hypothetical protein
MRLKVRAQIANALVGAEAAAAQKETHGRDYLRRCR